MHLKGNGVWNRQLPSDRFNARKRKHICLTKKKPTPKPKKKQTQNKKKNLFKSGTG